MHTRTWLLALLLPAVVAAGCSPVIADTKGVLVSEDGVSVGEDGGDDGGSDGDDGGADDPLADNDGDGSVARDDCDDDDPDSYPGADESFDGRDNDCDGWVDEVEVCSLPGATIQEVMDDAPDGATILICAGEWPEQLDARGRQLVLAGESGAADTIVTAQGEGVALTVADRADIGVVGLTLADGAGETGGGVACSGGSDLAMTESVVRDSVALRGGGLGSLGCELSLDRTELSGNAATEQGGGIFAQGTAGLIDGSALIGNVALEGGGAFLYEGSIAVSGTEFLGNEATTADESTWGSGSGGGGVWSNSTGAFTDNVVAENHSGYNGGGAYFYRGRPQVTGNTVRDNTCDEDGAGLYFNISAATISGNLISGNVAADDAGGLRLFYGNSTIEDNTFVGNAAGDDGGGAKFSHSEHVFRNNVLEGNETGDAGGGLELDNDSTHVEGSTFIGNRARRGAGLHNWRTETTFTIETSTFEGNVAGDCGGALSFDNSPHRITLSQLTVVGNEAVDGAALCTDLIVRDPEDVGGVEGFYEDTILRVENSVFADNIASDDGALYVKAGVVDFLNVVVSDNSGPGAGALAVKGSPVTLKNAVVTGNSGGAALLVEDTDDASGTLTVSYSDLWDNDGNAWGMDDPVGSDGNVGADPRLTGSWALGAGSPCIDAGDPDVRDRDGSRSDMGMYGGPGAP